MRIGILVTGDMLLSGEHMHLKLGQEAGTAARDAPCDRTIALADLLVDADFPKQKAVSPRRRRGGPSDLVVKQGLIDGNPRSRARVIVIIPSPW
jgi:hypothetical protein